MDDVKLSMLEKYYLKFNKNSLYIRLCYYLHKTYTKCNVNATLCDIPYFLAIIMFESIIYGGGRTLSFILTSLHFSDDAMQIKYEYFYF